MNTDQIDEIFNYINRTGEFTCSITRKDSDIIAYKVEADIEILEEPYNLTIDVNFYLNQNTTVFIMFISKGYWGTNSSKIDRLLMNINSIVKGGHFAYWYKTNDIIFRINMDTEYLDLQKTLRTLRYFEKVYRGVKPKLESYASEWDLGYITDDEQSELTKSLEWFFKGIERTLLE